MKEMMPGHSQDMAAAKELADKATKESAKIHEKEAAHVQKTIAGLQKAVDQLTQAMTAQQVLPCT